VPQIPPSTAKPVREILAQVVRGFAFSLQPFFQNCLTAMLAVGSGQARVLRPFMRW